MAKHVKPELISDFLSQLLKDNFKHKADILSIIPVWSLAVGPQISKITQVAAFNRGILSVSVLSSPWLTELQFIKKDIIEKLQNTLPKKISVKDIRFQLGSIIQDNDTDTIQNKKSIIPSERIDYESPDLEVCIDDKLIETQIKNTFRALYNMNRQKS